MSRRFDNRGGQRPTRGYRGRPQHPGYSTDPERDQEGGGNWGTGNNWDFDNNNWGSSNDNWSSNNDNWSSNNDNWGSSNDNWASNPSPFGAPPSRPTFGNTTAPLPSRTQPSSSNAQ